MRRRKRTESAKRSERRKLAKRQRVAELTATPSSGDHIASNDLSNVVEKSNSVLVDSSARPSVEPYTEEIAIVVLKREQAIHLEGNALFCVAFGVCAVLGATLHARENEFYHPFISAPLASHYVSIETGAGSGPGRHRLNGVANEKACRTVFEDKDLDDFVRIRSERADVGDCILVFRSSKDGAYVKTKDAYNEGNTSTSVGTLHARTISSLPRFLPYLSMTTSPASQDSIVKGLTFAFPMREKYAEFDYWPEWSAVCDTVEKAVLEKTDSHQGPRFAVTGPRGAGKSTFTRALTNYCLTHGCPRILYVDTDVGQSELSPPGLISAHLVSHPLIGSSIGYNQIPPVSAFFFGATSPSFDPQAYLQGLERVIHDACAYARATNCPIIMNTHGWTSGAGLELLQASARNIKATHTFHLSAGAGDGNMMRTSNYIPVTSMSRAVGPPVTSSQARELNMTAYFVSALSSRSEISMPFGKKGVSLYRINLNRVQIRVLGESLSADCVLMALNGSLVGLADAKDNWNCVGLGIVRAVCPEKREIFVSTPCVTTIQKASGLVLSAGLELPQSLIKATSRASVVPFLMRDTITTAGAIKARPSLQRKVR